MLQSTEQTKQNSGRETSRCEKQLSKTFRTVGQHINYSNLHRDVVTLKSRYCDVCHQSICIRWIIHLAGVFFSHNVIGSIVWASFLFTVHCTFKYTQTHIHTYRLIRSLVIQTRTYNWMTPLNLIGRSFSLSPDVHYRFYCLCWKIAVSFFPSMHTFSRFIQDHACDISGSDRR